MDIFQSVPARLILALLIVFMALSEFMAPMMALAYHEHDIVLLNFLGARTPGDDYHRFIPVIVAVPAWLLSVWIASGLLFIGSAYQLLHKSKAALLLFVLGVAFNLLGSLSQNLIPSLMLANHVAAAFPHPNFRRDVIVPLGSRVLLPALIAVCLWWMARVKSSHPQSNS